MSRGKASGYTLTTKDAALVKGMAARNDRDHDIAAWFGVNQGRVAEVKDGTKFGGVAAAPANGLPPKGAPGVKGRVIRASVEKALALLNNGDTVAAISELESGKASYDKDEA